MSTNTITVPGVANVPVRHARDADGLAALRVALTTATAVAVDTETHDATTFENGLWSALRVISIATRHADGMEAFVVDVRDVDRAALAQVMATIEQAHAWNANFDERVLALAGCPVRRWRDAMLTDALLHAGAEGFGGFYHALAIAAQRLLGISIEGKGTTQTSYDADSDLSDEQVRYAAADAVITLLVAEELDARAERAGLSEAVRLEQDARPFISAMTVHGIPFDTQGWSAHLAGHEARRDAALALIAELTVAAEPTLEDVLAGTDAALRPGFKVDSDPELRAALNTYARDLVHAYTGGRDLARTDTLDKTAMKAMIQTADRHPDNVAFARGARLLSALLTYRTHAKILSTYGKAIIDHVAEDGRLHPQYKQALVATGRLSSDKPNAQNLSPEMKPFLAPKPGRVFVYADLSQAELRVLAQLAGEPRMVEMFLSGGDFHALTAASMFSEDMTVLASADPERYSLLRKKAKGVNFGIPYGLGAAALATNLTVNSGVETTPAEAKEMLEAYARTYPNVDAWLRERDGQVRSWVDNPPEVDWDASMKLLKLWQLAEGKRRALRRKLGHWPSGAELAEAVTSFAPTLGETVEAVDREQLARDLDWAFGFDAAVALGLDGQPIAFEGRTASGRRRLYQVPMESSGSDKFAGVITSAMLIAATTDKPEAAAVRDAFAAEYGLDLPQGVARYGKTANRWESQARRRAERVQCVKAFEGPHKPLKLAFVQRMLDTFGTSAGRWLLTEALREQIRTMSTKFRNQPIQGLVADIVLDAYGDLYHRRLPKFPGAVPVTSIHDSIVLECDEADAPALAAELQDALESAMKRWCPDVPAKADCDIRGSFDDASVIVIEAAAA